MNTKFDIGDEAILYGKVKEIKIKDERVNDINKVIPDIKTLILYTVSCKAHSKGDYNAEFTVKEDQLIRPNSVQDMLKDITDEDLIVEMRKRGLIVSGNDIPPRREYSI